MNTFIHPFPESALYSISIRVFPFTAAYLSNPLFSIKCFENPFETVTGIIDILLFFPSFFIVAVHDILLSDSLLSNTYERSELMNKTTFFTGVCPCTNQTQEISIDYAEIRIPGSLEPGYKKMGFACKYASECSEVQSDPYGRCPLFNSAPSRPY